MAIDVHAHYVPARILEALRVKGADLGIALIDQAAGCPCLNFDYGLNVRPFFAGLLESESERVAKMDRIGIERQVLSLWCDIFGYGLNARQATAWHGLMNEALAAACARFPARFSWFASVPLPHAAASARELERCVRELGAAGGVLAANCEGTNLGELALDEFWAAAEQLNVPIFIHPAQPQPLPRTGRFGLNAIVQYTMDTTLTVGSLIFSGVLDRFPQLDLLLSHGGGALPYLIGRFDCMHGRMHPAEGNVAKQAPSAYLRRFHYDTIVHNPAALRFLASQVDVDRIVLGSDDPFPPMDKDPLASVRAAGFSDREIRQIASDNPRRLLRIE